MSSINLWFAIPATVSGIILILGNIGTHEKERADFRGKIVDEALMILDHLILIAHQSISCPVWSSRAEGFKADLLGGRDYGLWKQFYASVQARNEYFTPREGFAWPDVEKFARECFENFFKVYDAISWVKESIPQATIDDLLSRAKRSAATSGFVRHLCSQQ